MKHIKTLLAIATVALLGSSAQADDTITLKVGERFPLTDAGNYSFTYSGGARWYKLSTANNTGANEFVQGVFEDAHETKSYLSNGIQDTTKFYFVGTRATTTAVKMILYRCGASDDLVPDTDAQYPYRGYSGKDRDSNQWMACDAQNYTITVIDPEQPDVSEDVKLTTEDDAVVKTAPDSQEAGEWLMKLIPADTKVVSAQFDATTRQVTIAPLAIGSATVRILKGTTGVIDYKVTVANPSAKSMITSSVTPTGTDDQPIYSFTDTSKTGSLKIPANYKATVQLLVVGGGGGGGYASSTSTRYGNGGDGGKVLGGNNSTITRTVGSGETLNITVGAGGAGGTAAQKGNTDAQPGGYSSVTGGSSFGADVKADGGLAGGNTQSSSNAKNGTGAGATQSGRTTGVDSNLRTGSNVTYGEGGAKGSNSDPSAGNNNTGKGGGGARATSSGTSRRNGAAGGSGIVVIKILSFEALPKPAVKSAIAGTLTYGQALSTIANNQISATMTNAQGQAVSGSFVWDCDTTVKPTVAESGVAQYAATFTPSGSDYWSPVKVKLAVTVNRKTLTATATSFSVERGRPVTAEDYEVTYSGWVNGESAATAAGFEPATATSEYSPTTQYPDSTQLDIIVSGGEADNYAFSYVNGKLTVLKPSKSDVQLTDVDNSSGVNGKNIDDETGRPVVMLGGKTYTFDADANNSEIALMNAGKYAATDSYQLEGDEISKFLLGEFAGESFAEAFLPEGAWFTDGSFAISADGTTVTFDGGTLSYNDDDFTVPFAGTIELAGDLTISVGDELTVKFPADVTFTGSGKIIKTGAGTLDFDGEITDVSAEGYEGEVDGEVHQPTVSYTFTPAATVDPARTAVVKYKQAGESAWTTEAPSFSEVVDTTVDYQILVAGILKASGTYAVKITQKEPETEPISIVMGESQKVTCEGVFDDEEWTVTITGADGLVTVDPMEFTGKVFQPTITAGNAKGTATVTIASANVKYVYTVTVVASYDEGKVNLAYAGEGMADEVTMFYWYRSSDTKYKPRHMQATPNPGSSYANTDRSAEAVAACNAILDVALNATNAYACVDTRMVAKTSEGETKVGVWRSSDPLSHDDKYDPEGVKTKLGGTPQDSGTYAVVLKPKRVVYVGKSIKAYCTTSFDAASGSRESIYLSAPWTAESADEDVATITASGDAATSFEPEFTGVGIGRTYATVGNLQISTGMSADGSWPSDVTAPSPAPSVVTNGASYKLWVEVRDTPVADGQITGSGTIKVGEKLNTIDIVGTMVDAAGEEVEGTFAWVDGETIIPEPTGTQTFQATFTPDGEFYDEVTVDVTVTVKPALIPVAVPTAAQGLVYNGNEQTGVVENVGYTLTGNFATDADDYTAVATLADGYIWADGSSDPTNINWTIAAKPVEVTADDQTMLVGGELPELTYEVTDGELVKGDVLVGTLEVDGNVEEVGEYDIIQKDDWVNPNYDITFVKGKLTVGAGKITVNGKGYDTVAEAYIALVDAAKSGKATAVFNEAVANFNGYSFAKGGTLTVEEGGRWTVTGDVTAAMIEKEKTVTVVDSTLTLGGDIYVGDRADWPTEVTSSNVVLAANVTVGAATEGFKPVGIATLAFEEINVNGHKLTLTTNGVVQSVAQLTIDDVFAKVDHFGVVEKAITGGFEYTLEASEFEVKYYDNDGITVVHTDTATILNYMTDLHIWNGDRKDLVLLGYTREDKVTPLAVSDAALRAYVKDEADKPGCDGEVKVFGTWKKATITIKIVMGDGVDDVQTNGVSVVGNLELSADATEVELELVKDVDLTVPVFKVVCDNVTNVTTKVATYDIADGDTLEFFAEEAEEDDPTVTPEQRKAAIIDAIDEPDWDDEDEVKRYYKAIDKVKVVVGEDADQVPAKDFAAYITDRHIQSSEIADCDYVAASVKLDTGSLIDEDTEVEIAELVKAEGDALTFAVDIENARVEVEAIKDMVEASSDLTDWVKNKLEVNAEFDPNEYKVTITPVNPTDKAFMRVVIPQDPGVK